MAPPKRKPLPADDDDAGDSGSQYSYAEFPAAEAKLAGTRRDIEARLWLHLDWLADNANYYAHKPGREGVISDSTAKIVAQLISLKKAREDGRGGEDLAALLASIDGDVDSDVEEAEADG